MSDVRAVTTPHIGSRDIDERRDTADEALREYIAALRFWNAPDHDHTLHQIRRLVEEVIEDEYRV